MHEQSPSGSHSQPQHGSENTDFVLESQGFSVSVRTWDLEALLLPFPLTLSVVILCTRSGLPVQTENHAPAAGYLLGSGVATTPATPGLPVRSSGSRQFGLPQRTEPNGETPGSVAPRHSEPAQGLQNCHSPWRSPFGPKGHLGPWARSLPLWRVPTENSSSCHIRACIFPCRRVNSHLKPLIAHACYWSADLQTPV